MQAHAAAMLAVAAAQPSTDPWLERSFTLHRGEAWDNLHFWDEPHTAAPSIRPEISGSTTSSRRCAEVVVGTIESAAARLRA